MSAVAYLSTSKRTSVRAAKESWKLILRDLKVASSIQFPATVTKNNIQIFHSAYASTNVRIQEAKQFLLNELTDENSSKFYFAKNQELRATEYLSKMQKVNKPLVEINDKYILKLYMP